MKPSEEVLRSLLVKSCEVYRRTPLARPHQGPNSANVGAPWRTLSQHGSGCQLLPEGNVTIVTHVCCSFMFFLDPSLLLSECQVPRTPLVRMHMRRIARSSLEMHAATRCRRFLSSRRSSRRAASKAFLKAQQKQLPASRHSAGPSAPSSSSKPLGRLDHKALGLQWPYRHSTELGAPCLSQLAKWLDCSTP